MTNLISRLFGKFASHKFARWFQNIINRTYVSMFKIDLSEFAPVQTYASLNDLFTRALSKPRSFNAESNVMISPTDSMIMAFGSVDRDLALQIKGMEYSVSELLGGERLDSSYSFINFYLSPRDYHRYHAPCDMEVFEVRYFGGELLAVNKPSLLRNKNLFVRNERVVVCAKDKNGANLYFVAIGALNVGKMLLHFEPRIQTNAHPNQKCKFSYAQSIRIKKGEELGMFMMGSTVVLFAKDINPELIVEQKVSYGDSIATF